MKSKPQLLILRRDSNIFLQTFFKCLIIFKSRKVAGFFQWQPFEILMHITLDWHDIISLHFIFPFFSKLYSSPLFTFFFMIHFTEVCWYYSKRDRWKTISVLNGINFITKRHLTFCSALVMTKEVLTETTETMAETKSIFFT